MRRSLLLASALAGALTMAACGPAEQVAPEGLPTPADLQRPVPVESGFPAQPVIPTPPGPGDTMVPAPPPSAIPTP